MTVTHRNARAERTRRFGLNPLLLALASAGLVAVGPASAANFTVSNANDSGANSLRQAVIDANGNGDASNAINFSLPTGSVITLTGGQITVSKTLTLTGPGNNGITISGNLADRIFDVTPTVAVDPNDRADTELIIEGLTLRNGRVTGNGGCIQATPNEYNNVSLTLVNSIVTGCSAESTDTADNTFPLDFTNGAFNPSGMGGGIFAANVDIEPDQGFIPTVSLIDSTVSGNTARIAGGGLVGGAVYAQRSRISDNSVLGGEVTAIVGGNAGKYSVFTTGTGGGLLSLVADLENSTISGNSVNTVTFPAIPNGPSQPFQVGSAGGIHAIFGFEVRNSTISGNTVRATTPDATTYAVLLLGGGVTSWTNILGNFLLSNSTVSGNALDLSAANNIERAIAFGGGLSMASKYGIQIENSTISGNRLQSGNRQEAIGLGAGIGLKYSSDPGSITLNSTIVGGNTFSGNFVNGSGASGSYSALRDINLATPDPTDAITITGANNLVTSVDTRITMPGDTLAGNPQIAPLANQGGVSSGAVGGAGTGPNQTMALYNGSPAIDTGNNLGSLEFDQRGAGFPRVTGAAADIGAYEGSIPRPLTSVPTLGTLGLGLLSGLLGMAGIAIQRLRRRPSSSG